MCCQAICQASDLPYLGLNSGLWHALLRRQCLKVIKAAIKNCVANLQGLKDLELNVKEEAKKKQALEIASGSIIYFREVEGTFAVEVAYHMNPRS